MKKKDVSDRDLQQNISSALDKLTPMLLVDPSFRKKFPQEQRFGDLNSLGD